jgi:hypothetical protein
MADLNFLNVTTACTDIEINTPTAGKTYLQYISGLITKDFSAIKSYQIKYSSNCCPNIELVLPVRYALNLDQASPLLNCVVGSSTVSFDIVINGINKNLIDPSSLLYSINNITYTSTILTSSTTPTVNVSVPIPSIFPTTYTIYIKFKNLDGFEYIVAEDFEWSNPLNLCDINEPDNFVVTYPALPSNVVIDGSGNLDFDLLLGSTTGAVSSGVYQVIICEETLTSLSCIQNFYFVDCGLKCSVIAKLAECKDSDILFFYDALTYSNDCQDSVSYTEVCAMFELMNKKLSSPDCKSPWDDCNCNGTTKIYNQNNSSATTVRNCNC